MFKLYNIVFYIICSSYRKHENYEKDAPPLNVFFILAISFYCQMLLGVGLWNFIEDPYHISSGLTTSKTLFMVLSGMIITYLLFYLSKKYIVIYETYKDNSFANSRLAKFVGWSFIILSILSPFIFILIRNKIYFGNWV